MFGAVPWGECLVKEGSALRRRVDNAWWVRTQWGLAFAVWPFKTVWIQTHLQEDR